MIPVQCALSQKFGKEVCLNVFKAEKKVDQNILVKFYLGGNHCSLQGNKLSTQVTYRRNSVHIYSMFIQMDVN